MKKTFRFALVGLVGAIALGMGIIAAQDAPPAPANAVNLVGPLHPVYENPDGTVLDARYVSSPISDEAGTTIAQDITRIQTQQETFIGRINTLGDEDLSLSGTITAHSARITTNEGHIQAIQADDWVTGRRIAAETIGSGNLVDNIIDQERLIADNVVEGQHIAADQIIQGHLQDNVVGTDELINGSITGSKLTRTLLDAIENAGGGGGPDGIPDAPDKASAAATYLLQVPATGSALDPSWTVAPPRTVNLDTAAGLGYNDEGEITLSPTLPSLVSALWPGKASATPVQLTHDTGAFTMKATLDRVEGTYPAGAHMRIVLGGRNGPLVPAVANDFNSPATLAFTLAQTTALLTQARDHVVRAELRIYDDDQATTHIGTLPLDFPVVQPNTILGWRTIAGRSGAYTVRLTDSEFVVWVEHTNDSVEYGIAISRSRLGTRPKNFGAAQNNLDNHEWYGVAANLNAAGTQLTITEAGQTTGAWSILAVEAR